MCTGAQRSINKITAMVGVLLLLRAFIYWHFPSSTIPPRSSVGNSSVPTSRKRLNTNIHGESICPDWRCLWCGDSKILIARTRKRSGKSKQRINLRRFVCRLVCGSCSLFWPSSSRQIRAAVRVKIHMKSRPHPDPVSYRPTAILPLSLSNKLRI